MLGFAVEGEYLLVFVPEHKAGLVLGGVLLAYFGLNFLTRVEGLKTGSGDFGGTSIFLIGLANGLLAVKGDF